MSHGAGSGSGYQHAKPRLASGLTARRLFFPFLLTSAVSSLAINLRNARDDLRELRSKHAARISVLHGIVSRLEAGQAVSPEFVSREYERVGITERRNTAVETSVGWREMLFGRKRTEQDRAIEAKELKDLEDAIERVGSGRHEATVKDGQHVTAVLPAAPAPIPAPAARREPAASTTVPASRPSILI